MDEDYDHEYDLAFICAECVEDDDLRAFIEANADEDDEEACTFCDAEGEGVVVCRFNDLMAHVEACIDEYYDLAANNLGWESAEGGWQGEYWDTYDLLADKIGIGLPNDFDTSLLDAMCSYLGHKDWCHRNPYGESQLESLTFDWDKFTHVVKHETRFFLTRYEKKKKSSWLDNGRALPENALKAIGSAALRMSLFTELPAGTLLYRVRYEKKGPLTTPNELGPPLCEKAFVSNRMSPPGIVMFYAAFDRDTALAETCKKAGGYSIGTFRTLVPLYVLDLTAVPEVPGFFASIPDSREWGRADALFFHHLVDDLTKPIERDERVHLEYIPTQVVVEYFRRRFHRDFRELEPEPVQGVLYSSARKAGGRAIVLFCDRSMIAGTTDEADELFGADTTTPRWLELAKAKSVTLDADAIAEMKEEDDAGAAAAGLADS